MKINLFQAEFPEATGERKNEIDFCRNYNISSVHACRGSYVSVQGWPTFNHIFEGMRCLYPFDVNIVCNSDIYFDAAGLVEIFRLMNLDKTKKYALALTRYDVLPDKSTVFFDRSDSQDAWAFMGGVPNIKGADFPVGGVPGCDNKIAYLLHENGYEVYNPSLTVKCYHLHNVPVRNYETVNKGKLPVLLPPYRLLPPTDSSFVDTSLQQK